MYSKKVMGMKESTTNVPGNVPFWREDPHWSVASYLFPLLFPWFSTFFFFLIAPESTSLHLHPHGLSFPFYFLFFILFLYYGCGEYWKKWESQIKIQERVWEYGDVVVHGDSLCMTLPFFNSVPLILAKFWGVLLW